MCRSIAVQRVGVASLLRSDRCSHHRRCSCNQSTPLPPSCQGSSANRYEGVRSILRSASSTAYAGIRGTPLTPLGSISRLRPRDVRIETLILCILYETFIHLCTSCLFSEFCPVCRNSGKPKVRGRAVSYVYIQALALTLYLILITKSRKSQHTTKSRQFPAL